MGSKMEIVGRIKTVLIIAMSFISSSLIANSYIIDIKDRNNMSTEALDIYNNIVSNPAVIWSTSTLIDIESLKSADTLYFVLDNENVLLFSNYKKLDNGYYYSRYVSADNQTNAYLSILENNLRGDISTANGRYQLLSISDNEVAIIKYIPSISEEPAYEDPPFNELVLEDPSNIESIVPNSTPVIRVLFLYTSSVLSMAEYPNSVSLRNEIYAYITEGNESFANSRVNAHLELAYLGQTNYIESSFSWSKILKHFYTQNDGYVDEVHTFRNKYKADICVLMVNDSTYCGEAKAIKADANTAFCIIWPKHIKCGWKYSPIHEFGHLIGCRHNRSADNSNSPYKYGHGYMYCNETTSSASWCTIMSYESTCSANSKRILYWSNPDTTYNGIATGTTTYENNARVWNERAGTVSAFRTKDNSIALTANDNNSSALFESYEASTSITTSSGYQVQAEQTVDMAAGNIIRLTSGTHIKIGSKFRASIRNNADNSPYPQFVIRKDTNDNRLQRQTNFSIIPNPVNDILTIVTEEEINNAVIYNLTGIQLLLSNSKYINVSSLPQGVYVISVVTKGNGTYQSKFVKQ